MPPVHPTHRYLLWLLLLVVALVVIAVLALFVAPSAPSFDSAQRTPPPPPPLTYERTVEAIGEARFSLLVSYTDQGFEPRAATIRAGETVRFVNNSTGAMNLSLGGAPQNLPPGEYWEATFDAAGNTAFYDASHPEGAASIRVE